MSFIAAGPEAASARQMSRLPGYIGAVLSPAADIRTVDGMILSRF
jgi:hypothetical protein